MKGKLSIISLALSTISISALFFINREIADRYLLAHGKTQALFGLVEMLSFSYKFYILIPTTFSFLLAAYAIKRKEISWVTYLATAIALFSIAAVFIRFWKLWI